MENLLLLLRRMVKRKLDDIFAPILKMVGLFADAIG